MRVLADITVAAPAAEDETPPRGAPVPTGAEPVLGALLRAWRERALVTQEELAARAGLNVRTVRRLEAGAMSRPRATSLRLLADALGLEAAELATLTRAATGTAIELTVTLRYVEEPGD
ncbi:helix-turn-helix domain-containing protein [Nonomuraea wenchangensis]|uniref:Helix-turn-helix domain-containing protein n=1 Tax=Nonomuraea wenchangensis TaxID=568860 RepID=A0A1H9YHN3_9ACTN|nr:helix-turn-helix transcriptional regulator [Nonomuraea wenchangensis]SES68095.1 Helix-turn-helix domain-containing protein [Nonomuraea wenchangensis]